MDVPRSKRPWVRAGLLSAAIWLVGVLAIDVAIQPRALPGLVWLAASIVPFWAGGRLTHLATRSEWIRSAALGIAVLVLAGGFVGCAVALIRYG